MLIVGEQTGHFVMIAKLESFGHLSIVRRKKRKLYSLIRRNKTKTKGNKKHCIPSRRQRPNFCILNREQSKHLYGGEYRKCHPRVLTTMTAAPNLSTQFSSRSRENLVTTANYLVEVNQSMQSEGISVHIGENEGFVNLGVRQSSPLGVQKTEKSSFQVKLHIIVLFNRYFLSFQLKTGGYDDKVDKIKRDNEISSGGSASVFQGSCEVNGKKTQVALKYFRSGCNTSIMANEYNILRSLSHPNIVKLVCFEPSLNLLVLEYCVIFW